MYALTLHPHWAWAMVNLGKRVENRPWKPAAHHIGTRIAIHAGRWPGGAMTSRDSQAGIARMIAAAARAGWDYQAPSGNLCGTFQTSRALRVFTSPPAGCIVAVATLRYVTTANLADPWVETQCYHWVLDDVERLKGGPIPCRGKQRLWRMSAAQRDSVLRGCSAATGVAR